MYGLNSTVMQANTETYVLTPWIFNKLWGSYHYFPHFWGGNQGRKKSFNLLKVIKSVSGVSDVWTHLTWVQSPQHIRSSLLCCTTHYNTLHNHTAGTDAIASHGVQENSKETPSFACLVFEAESHSSPDWPWPPLNLVIISMSHQTWPTYLFKNNKKIHYLLKHYMYFTDLFLPFNRRLFSVNCQFYCLNCIMSEKCWHFYGVKIRVMCTI